MNSEQEQHLLQAIVETWRPSAQPEYRGFRCANCQEYKNEAWYHWLSNGGYRLPIHMCGSCEESFQSGTLQINAGKRQTVNRATFGTTHSYSHRALERFREIVSSWPKSKQPEYKAYTCDECSGELHIDPIDGLRKGHHVWWKMDDGQTLAELHFHRECGEGLGILS